MHSKVRRFKCDTEVRAFDADGMEHRFTPECHVCYSLSWKSSPNNGFQFQSRVTQLKMFFDLLHAGYVNGKPLHIAEPETSLFDIIPSTEFEGLSTQQILGRLRHRHIVVTGNSHSEMEFDKVGLRTLCPPSRVVSIQGTVNF